MCVGCKSGTQGAYNTGDENENSKPFEDNNGAQSQSGSVSESGLGDPAQSVKYDLAHSSGAKNSSIGNSGFGA